MGGVCEKHGPHGRKECDDCKVEAMVARDFPERLLGPWREEVAAAGLVGWKAGMCALVGQPDSAATYTLRWDHPHGAKGHYSLTGDRDDLIREATRLVQTHRLGMAEFEEPDGFAQWLGRHCRLAKVEVPRAGSPRRRLLARVFAALEETGHDVGVLARGLEVGMPERALACVWGWIAAELEHGEDAGRPPSAEDAGRADFVDFVLRGGASPLPAHPDLCPTCRAPVSRAQRERINAAVDGLRCTCPVGFGSVADPGCPRHGATARHTITGPPEVLGEEGGAR